MNEIKKYAKPFGYTIICVCCLFGLAISAEGISSSEKKIPVITKLCENFLKTA